LFVGSGKALADGGPGSLLISFSIVALMLYCTVYSLGEMSCMFPIAGSFSAFATRFLDPAWGFAMGLNVSHIVNLKGYFSNNPSVCFTMDGYPSTRNCGCGHHHPVLELANITSTLGYHLPSINPCHQSPRRKGLW
jgi:amino acid transporter